jgi:hypothetical protein
MSQNQKETCSARFFPLNGETVTPCHKPIGHEEDEHHGWCLGSLAVWYGGDVTREGDSSVNENQEKIKVPASAYIGERGCVVCENSPGKLHLWHCVFRNSYHYQDEHGNEVHIKSLVYNGKCLNNQGHLPDFNTILMADDTLGVIDISCSRCGRSGSVRINPEDINW